jgi:hypothetical protein
MVIQLVGYLFVKHVKWGSPKLRLVHADDDQLYWSETDYMYDRSKSKGSIPLSSIISIKDGLERARKPKYYGNTNKQAPRKT